MNIEEFRIRMNLSDQQFKKLQENISQTNKLTQKPIKTKFDVTTKKIILV